MTYDEALKALIDSWPKCGEPYVAGEVAGEPVVCDLVKDHMVEKCFNTELRVSWYGRGKLES
jgi:hypothetical protein